MASVAEMFVSIGADISDFSKGMKQVTQAGKRISDGFKDATGQFISFGSSGTQSLELIQSQTQKLNEHIQTFKESLASGGSEMSNAMKKANDELRMAQEELSMLTSYSQKFGPEFALKMVEAQKPMMELQNKSRDLQKQWTELAFNRAQFDGDTNAMMAKIQQLGAEQKKLNDQMLAMNQIGFAAIAQQVGTLMAASTQSQKIADNYNQMGNALYELNTPLLSITSNLEKMARAGTPAALALKQLGPNANMKDLQDRIRMINQGLMRMQMVALGAGLAFVGINVGLAKLAQANRLTGLSDALDRLGQTSISALLPFLQSWDAVMGKIVDGVNYIMQMVDAWSQANPQLSAAVGWFAYLTIGLTALLAPLAIGIGLTGGLSAAFSALWVTISPFIIGLAAVVGTAAALAAGFVALGVAAKNLWSNSETLRNSITNGWQQIKSVITTAISSITPAWENLKQAFLNLVATIIGGEPSMTNIWQTIGDAIGNFINYAVSTALPMIQQAFQFFATVVSTALNTVASVVNALAPVWQTIWPVLSFVVTAFVDAVKGAFEGLVNFISGIIKIFSSAFQGDWKGVWEGIKQATIGAVQFVWNAISLTFFGRLLSAGKIFITGFKTVFTGGWTAIKAVFSSSVSAVQSVVQSGFNFIKGIVDGTSKAMQSVITAVWNASKSVVSGAVNAIKGFVQSGFNATLNLVKTVMTGIQSVITSIWNVVKSTVTSVIQALVNILKNNFEMMKSAVTTAMNAVKTTITNMWNQIKSFFGSINLYDVGKNIIQGLINGIGSMAGALLDKARSIADSITETITGALDIHSPSRVMRGIGGYIGQGLALGMNDAAKMVDGASLNLAAASIPDYSGRSFNPSNSTTSNSGGNTYHIYIQGANADEVLAKLERKLVLSGVRPR
jgi:phage-related protein